MCVRARSISLALAALALPGCSSPDRPAVQDGSTAPGNCAEAVAAAFPDGRPGSLVAYREVERRCGSLSALAERGAYNGEVLRFDCAPAEIMELGATIRRPGTEVVLPPADLVGTPVCAEFNRECVDYDEVRRDRAEVIRRPTMANLDLYVNHRARLAACNEKYSK